MKLVILARESPFTIYLINCLAIEHNVVGVIFQQTNLIRKLTILNNRMKRIGLFRVLDQVLLIIFAKIFEFKRDKALTSAIFKDQPFDHFTSYKDTIRLNDINSNISQAFIFSKKPDLLIVNGTSLLKDNIYELCNNRVLNIHVGITPEYRGAYGGFWALYNNEPEKLGVTVHLVDKGIDTGTIIYQEQVFVDKNDTLHSVALKQQKKGAQLVLKAVNDFQFGTISSLLKTNSPSKLYYSPGFTQYLKYLKMKNKLFMPKG